MKISTGIIVLTAALGALALGLWGASDDWVSAGIMVGLGLGLIAVVGLVSAAVRNRKYRRLREMRDSALW